MTAKSTIQNKDKVGYKQIRDDLLKQMGSLQRKRKSEIASENLRLFKKIQSIQRKQNPITILQDNSFTMH